MSTFADSRESSLRDVRRINTKGTNVDIRAFVHAVCELKTGVNRRESTASPASTLADEQIPELEPEGP
jgi:hypothetical protein